jgi:hypothetical protein
MKEAGGFVGHDGAEINQLAFMLASGNDQQCASRLCVLLNGFLNVLHVSF